MRVKSKKETVLGCLFCLVIGCFVSAQDTLIVESPRRKQFALTSYYFNYEKSSIDSLVLSRQKSQSIELYNIDHANIIRQRLKQVNFIIVTKHGLKFEECFWDGESIISIYSRYWKNGRLRESGMFDDGGLKVGEWRFYSKNGLHAKSKFYNSGRKIKKSK